MWWCRPVVAGAVEIIMVAMAGTVGRGWCRTVVTAVPRTMAVVVGTFVVTVARPSHVARAPVLIVVSVVAGTALACSGAVFRT